MDVLREFELDEADIHDILEYIPGCENIQLCKEYRMNLLSALGDRTINPFLELMLVDAARQWRGNLMTTMTIASYITPDTIIQTFDELKQWTEKSKELVLEKKALLADRAVVEARMASEPDFKWGRNETEREAQLRTYAPDLSRKLDELELNIQDALNEVALIRLDLDRIQVLISYFSTISITTNEHKDL